MRRARNVHTRADRSSLSDRRRCGSSTAAPHRFKRQALAATARLVRPDRGLQIRRGALRRSRPGSTPAPSSTLLRARPSHLAAPGHGRSLPPMNLAGLPGALAEAVRSSASTPNRSCVPRMPRHAHPRPPPCSFRGVHRADRRRARVQIRPPAVPYAVPISAPASILAAPRSGQASDASSWPRARCAPPPDRAPRRRRRALVRQAVHTCVHSSAHTDTHSRRPPAELVRPHAQHPPHPNRTARTGRRSCPAAPSHLYPRAPSPFRDHNARRSPLPYGPVPLDARATRRDQSTARRGTPGSESHAVGAFACSRQA